MRGKDWRYGSQDNFGVGTITRALSGGFVGVTWEFSPFTYTYRMGNQGFYDLYLVAGKIHSHTK